MGIYLSQQEIRDILNKLDGLSLIKISKGRGGSKINSKGISVFNEMRNKY
jgi:Cdc6-like AAA superfamily ATPase